MGTIPFLYALSFSECFLPGAGKGGMVQSDGGNASNEVEAEKGLPPDTIKPMQLLSQR